MSKKYLYILLLSFTFHLATLRASFLRPSIAEKKMDELAINTLAVYEAISDPELSSFKDLISISKVEKPQTIEIYENYNSPVGDNIFSSSRTGPIVFTKNNEKVAYATLTASLATSALEIVQYKLRALRNPNERVSSFLKEWHSDNIHSLNDTPFDEIKRNFIAKFSDTLRSLDRTEEWRGKPYFVKFESHGRMERKFFSYRELTLRSLSCLLIASPNINDEGTKIVQEILKDQEVLEIIKLQFSSITANHEFERDIYLDFKDYLIHNSWSKGIANIFNELSEKDQHDVFNSSLENYVTFYNYLNVVEYRELTSDLNNMYQVLDFFQKPQALNKLSNLDKLLKKDEELAFEVARTLISIVSVPEYLDHPYDYSGIWAFAYYIVECRASGSLSLVSFH